MDSSVGALEAKIAELKATIELLEKAGKRVSDQIVEASERGASVLREGIDEASRRASSNFSPSPVSSPRSPWGGSTNMSIEGEPRL